MSTICIVSDYRVRYCIEHSYDQDCNIDWTQCEPLKYRQTQPIFKVEIGLIALESLVGRPASQQ